MSGRPWLYREVRFLRRSAGRRSARDIGEHLGRTEPAVHAKARALGVSLVRVGDHHPGMRYQDRDCALMRHLHYEAGCTIARIADAFSLPYSIAAGIIRYRDRGEPATPVPVDLAAVRDPRVERCLEPGAIRPKPNSPWSAVELDFLREHARTLTARAIGEALGRSTGAVHKLAERHAIKLLKRGDALSWTKYPDELMEAVARRLLAGDRPKVIALESGLPLSAIYAVKYRDRWTSVMSRAHAD